MAQKVIICVEGGVIQSVHCSDPETNVEVFDFDPFDVQDHHEGMTEEEYQSAYDEALETLSLCY